MKPLSRGQLHFTTLLYRQFVTNEIREHIAHTYFRLHPKRGRRTLRILIQRAAGRST